jgi:hypothetical protein
MAQLTFVESCAHELIAASEDCFDLASARCHLTGIRFFDANRMK